MKYPLFVGCGMIKGDCRKPNYGLGDEEYIQFQINLADS